MSIKQVIKLFIPKIIIILLQKKNKTWTGNFKSWSDAKKSATGYEQDLIIKTIDNSISRVYSGEFPYERDSVLFDEIQYSWSLLSGLMLAAATEGSINVLDFGGSLGSTYLQNIKFLSKINFKWNIVEQSKMVELGKKKYSNSNLKFYSTIESCMDEQKINTLLISSTLQYIEEPISFLNKIVNFNFKYIILDRISIIEQDSNRLTIQRVPNSIYKASYPCWFFNENIILNILSDKYNLVESFISYIPNETYIDGKLRSIDKGYIFKLLEI